MTVDPTTGVEKVPYHFAEGWGLLDAFFIAFPSSETKKWYYVNKKYKLN